MTREDLEVLREDWDFEAKLAAGPDGKGTLPKSLWETYSAMANTEGGSILLGARERKDRTLELSGIPEIDRVETDLWNQLENRQKVSVNLLTRERVQRIEVDGQALLLLQIPKAPRQKRPVHINGSPRPSGRARSLGECPRPRRSPGQHRHPHHQAPRWAEFVNPGLLLITPQQLWLGGQSVPRNLTLLHLFTLLRLGEKEGSGGPTMRQVWREQHWRAPRIWEAEGSTTLSRVKSLVRRFDVFIGGSFSNHLVADEEQRFLIELAEALPLPPDRARRIVDVFTILKLDALRHPSPQSAGVG